MKKFWLLASGFWLLASVVFAQQFKVGLLGGITTSQVDGDTYTGYGKAGFLVELDNKIE